MAPFEKDTRPIVICLMGPTASGKTALACEMMSPLQAEIVSIDSAMIYRGMDIGTAKPDQATLARYPHHLIDKCDPCETYSVAQCYTDVMHLCQSILARGRRPLLVGGSMMYFHALQQGLASLPATNESIRMKLLEEARCQGWDVLYQRLVQVDPLAAQRIHASDTQRIQRALEVYESSGQPLSVWLQQAVSHPTPWRWVNVLLLPTSRSWLHERIALRFQQMLTQGFVEEAEQVINQWHLTPSYPALRAVGYRQAYDYLQGRISYETFYEKGIAATRQLAKRQLTWLRKWPDPHCYPAESPPSVQSIVRDCIYRDNIG